MREDDDVEWTKNGPMKRFSWVMWWTHNHALGLTRGRDRSRRNSVGPFLSLLGSSLSFKPLTHDRKSGCCRRKSNHIALYIISRRQKFETTTKFKTFDLLYQNFSKLDYSKQIKPPSQLKSIKEPQNNYNVGQSILISSKSPFPLKLSITSA